MKVSKRIHQNESNNKMHQKKRINKMHQNESIKRMHQNESIKGKYQITYLNNKTCSNRIVTQMVYRSLVVCIKLTDSLTSDFAKQEQVLIKIARNGNLARKVRWRCLVWSQSGEWKLLNGKCFFFDTKNHQTNILNTHTQIINYIIL